MIQLLFFLATKEIFVIDFGSYNTRAANSSFDSPNVNLLLNMYSKLNTETFIGLKTSKSFDINSNKSLEFEDIANMTVMIGDDALTYMETHPSSGFGHFPFFFNRHSNFISQNSNSLSLDFNFFHKFGYFNLTAAFIYYFVQEVADRIPEDAQVGIVVPTTFGYYQRSVVESVAKLAGMKNVTCLSDADCIAYLYYQKRKPELGEDVLFIDIGATSVKAYVVKYLYKDDMRFYVSSYIIDENLGGAFITEKLADYIKKKISLDTTNKMYSRQIFQIAEKMKLKLSYLESVEMLVENINGKKYNINVTRGEFNDLIGDIVAKISKLALSAVGSNNIMNIELFGGSARIPFIKKSLLLSLRNQKIGHLFNNDESIIQGAISLIKSFPPYFTFYFPLDSYYFKNICKSSRNMFCSVNAPNSLSNITLFSPLLNNRRNNSINYHIINNDLKSTKFYIINMSAKYSKYPSIDSIASCNDSICKKVDFQVLPTRTYNKNFLEILTASSKSQAKIGYLRSHIEEVLIDFIYTNGTIKPYYYEYMIKSQIKSIEKLIIDVLDFLWNNNQINDVGVIESYANELDTIIVPIKARLEFDYRRYSLNNSIFDLEQLIRGNSRKNNVSPILTKAKKLLSEMNQIHILEEIPDGDSEKFVSKMKDMTEEVLKCYNDLLPNADYTPMQKGLYTMLYISHVLVVWVLNKLSLYFKLFQ